MPARRWMGFAIRAALVAGCVDAPPLPKWGRMHARAHAADLNVTPAGPTGQLALHVVSGSECGPVGDGVTVTLDVADLTDPINGVQSLLRYDPTLLILESLAPTDPWTEVVTVDDVGSIAFAAVVLGDATLADQTVATLKFTRVGEGTTSVIFRPDDPPFLTKLTAAATGATISPIVTGSGAIGAGLPDCTIVADAMVCPNSSGNVASVPDSGPGAAYTWSITGGTIESGDGTNVITYSAGPDGAVALKVTVTSPIGCQNSCNTEVPIAPTSLTVALEIEALGAPVTRDVTCVITDCVGLPDVRVVPVTFDDLGTGTFELPGVSIDAQWVSVSEGHTLSRLSPVVFDGCGLAAVDLTGPRGLLSGDFHVKGSTQDGVVDILDYSILAARWNTPIDPNESFGADATGDGMQDTADFTVILVNFLKQSEPDTGCVAAPVFGR